MAYHVTTSTSRTYVGPSNFKRGSHASCHQVLPETNESALRFACACTSWDVHLFPLRWSSPMEHAVTSTPNDWSTIFFKSSICFALVHATSFLKPFLPIATVASGSR